MLHPKTRSTASHWKNKPLPVHLQIPQRKGPERCRKHARLSHASFKAARASTLLNWQHRQRNQTNLETRINQCERAIDACDILPVASLRDTDVVLTRTPNGSMGGSNRWHCQEGSSITDSGRWVTRANGMPCTQNSKTRQRHRYPLFKAAAQLANPHQNWQGMHLEEHPYLIMASLTAEHHRHDIQLHTSTVIQPAIFRWLVSDTTRTLYSGLTVSYHPRLCKSTHTRAPTRTHTHTHTHAHALARTHALTHAGYLSNKTCGRGNAAE